jgi:NAD(P)-dependent dehydrogenase (short-subunit alcohol dehydrogenase family)
VELKGTTAIVTGVASGLGAATTRTLVEQGAQVVGIDLWGNGGMPQSTRDVEFVRADVTSGDDVASAVSTANRIGPLRTVVNCAGIAPSARILGRRGVHDLGLYAKVINVNLVGTFNVMSLAAEAMSRTDPLVDGQRGVVVNTASIAAFDGQVGQAAYAASKGGIAGLTLPAARDLAQYGIRVNAIAPGIVDTPMLATVSEDYREGLAAGVPFPKRLASASEFAQLVAMVIAHDYINGETIRMDGALRMAPR